jgi:hypothetical protein
LQAPYPEVYFSLQVRYASAMAALAHQPLAAALMTQTSLYKLLGAPGAFDRDEPIWRELVACVDVRATVDEQSHAIYQYYLERYPAIPTFGQERHWGCFAFEWRPTQRAIRIHFSNEDAPEPGPLSRERTALRLDELRAMFAVVRAERPDAERVIGGSWLYALDAYRRLFPPSFNASATPDEPHLQYRALWGQFLRHDWTVSQPRAEEFLARVMRLSDPARYAECFPYQVLLTSAPVSDFYAFYGV